MGAYNLLHVPRLLPCPNCGDDGEISLQFHYGDAQLDHYRVGQAVKWGGNDKGERTSGRVEFLGYQEPCGVCRFVDPRDYVITVDGGVVVGYRMATQEDSERLE